MRQSTRITMRQSTTVTMRQSTTVTIRYFVSGFVPLTREATRQLVCAFVCPFYICRFKTILHTVTTAVITRCSDQRLTAGFFVFFFLPVFSIAGGVASQKSTKTSYYSHRVENYLLQLAQAQIHMFTD